MQNSGPICLGSKLINEDSLLLDPYVLQHAWCPRAKSLVTYGSGKCIVTGWRIKAKKIKNKRDFYHTTCCRAAIFGVHAGLPNLVLTLTLWIGPCPMKRRKGVWIFVDVSVTYRRNFGTHTLAGDLCSCNIIPEPTSSFITSPRFYRTKLNFVLIFSSEWVIKLTAFWETADIGVPAVHTSRSNIQQCIAFWLVCILTYSDIYVVK